MDIDTPPLSPDRPSSEINVAPDVALEEPTNRETSTSIATADRRFTGQWSHGLGNRRLASSIPRPELSEQFSGPGFPPETRLLPPLETHAICNVWHSEVVPSIVAISSSMAVEIDSIHCLRVTRYDGFFDDFEAESAAPHVIWICLWDAIESSRAIQLLDTCLETVQPLSLDVHIEILTGRTRSLSASFALLTEDRFDEIAEVRRVRLPLMARVGMEIAPLGKAVTGTGGLFLKLQGSEELFLLTAQHCMTASQGEELRPDQDGSSANPIVLMCAESFSVFTARVARAVRYAREAIGRVAASSPTSGYDAFVEIAASRLHYLEDLHTRLLQDWFEPASRIIGRNYCHSTIGVATGSFTQYQPSPPRTADQHSQSMPCGFSEDWGLIRLDRERFPQTTALNVVRFPEDPEDRPEFFGDHVPQAQVLQINSVAPVSRMHQQRIPVLKSGAKTGVTYGSTSPLKSFVRSRDWIAGGSTASVSTSSETFWTWEIPVFSSKVDPFCRTGDSGGILVDRNGEALAMVTRGVGDERSEEIDITLATPLEFILERIKAMCGREASLA